MHAALHATDKKANGRPCHRFVVRVYRRKRWYREGTLVDIVEPDHLNPRWDLHAHVGETPQHPDGDRVSDAKDPVETLAACRQRPRHLGTRLHGECLDVYDERGIKSNA